MLPEERVIIKGVEGDSVWARAVSRPVAAI